LKSLILKILVIFVKVKLNSNVIKVNLIYLRLMIMEINTNLKIKIILWIKIFISKTNFIMKICLKWSDFLKTKKARKPLSKLDFKQKRKIWKCYLLNIQEKMKITKHFLLKKIKTIKFLIKTKKILFRKKKWANLLLLFL
jgi:hypothetical protein